MERETECDITEKTVDIATGNDTKMKMIIESLVGQSSFACRGDAQIIMPDLEHDRRGREGGRSRCNEEDKL